MKTSEYTQAARARHHKALESLHASPETADGLQLWRKLRIIEARASRGATDYCNGEIDMDEWEAISEAARRAVAKALGGRLPEGFFVNGDPRGYALKIDGVVPEGMHTDWGRNGCLAAEID